MTYKVRVPSVRNGPVEETGRFVPFFKVCMVARRLFVQKDVTLVRGTFGGYQSAPIGPRIGPGWIVKDHCIKVLYWNAAIVRTTEDLTLPNGAAPLFKPFRSTF